MAWQDVSPLDVSHIDAEEERELRLAAQARAGAEWALAALVARYQPPVTRYLTRLTGDQETARTLAEVIFVRMEKRVRGPQGGQRLRLWVLRACTEAGLDYLRDPHQQQAAAPQLHGPRLAGLLPERAGEGATKKLRAGLGALASITGSTSRQVRGLIWSAPPETPRRARKPLPPRYPDSVAARGYKPKTERRTPPLAIEDDPAEQDPREALRFRMVRAVLAELPYGDAQCLALHLIAGLNQAEVARALGITNSATRRRIVHGLQLFAQRYEAAAASLSISPSTLAPSASHATPPQVTTPPPASLPSYGSGMPSPEDDRASASEALAAPGAPITPPEDAVKEVEALPFSFSEPLPASATGADMPTSDGYEPELSNPSVNEGKAPIIVEATAVVHDAPVAGTLAEDTSIASVPDMGVDDTAMPPDEAASELIAHPPDVEPDAISVSPAEAEEMWDASKDASAEDASTGSSESASAAASGETEVAAQVSARFVPILSSPSANSDTEAPATTSGRAEQAGLDAAEQEAAVAPADTPIAPHPVRLIPVLTTAIPGMTGVAMAGAPSVPLIPSVRTVPVLTPLAPPDPPPLAMRLAGGDVNTDEAPHEVIAMTAMTPEDATLDA